MPQPRETRRAGQSRQYVKLARPDAAAIRIAALGCARLHRPAAILLLWVLGSKSFRPAPRRLCAQDRRGEYVCAMALATRRVHRPCPGCAWILTALLSGPAERLMGECKPFPTALAIHRGPRGRLKVPR